MNSAPRTSPPGAPRPSWIRVLWAALLGYALVQIGIALMLFINHAPAPFNLEAMESTILEHVRRLMTGLPLYTDPTPQFAALAYTPLYYIVSVPFVWLFGSSLLALRLSAITATLAAGVMVFVIVRRHTGSRGWAWLATGLFAAAYRVMDCYLDTAHADAWLLFATLLGCHLIDQQHSSRRSAAGIAVLAAAFWFKQHGALFAAAALAYLVWRDGPRRAWPAVAIAAALGPLLYAVAPAWLGQRFHDYTWAEPRRWMSLDFDAWVRLARCLAFGYPLLAVLGLGGLAAALAQRRVNIWYALLPVAIASGLLGAMDSGSLDNVFIPLGTWLILTGTMALKQWADRVPAVQRWGVHAAVLAVSFALLAYDPAPLLVPAQAARVSRELARYARSLDGPVYAPMIGTLPAANPFSPTLHWVALEDLVRGPQVDERNHPLVRKLLEPVLHPTGTAYLLLDKPLEQDPLLDFLAERYVLHADLGDRFEPIAAQPRRVDIGPPRYLYRSRESGK